jgi:hypothetical protein
MVMVFAFLIILLALGSLACFVMVLIKMFQEGDQTLGIVCIVLAFCTGIGTLIAYIFGWINSSKYDIKNLMWIWTGIWIALILLEIIFFASGLAERPLK